jgi:hypothetical protein
MVSLPWRGMTTRTSADPYTIARREELPLEHWGDYKKMTKDKRVPDDHFMKQHFMEHHNDLIQERIDANKEEWHEEDFSFQVTKTFQKPTMRILDESSRVRLEESGQIKSGKGEAPILIMNTKN